jgi:hypothetical protein
MTTGKKGGMNLIYGCIKPTFPTGLNIERKVNERLES